LDWGRALEKQRPRLKRYLSEVQQGVVPSTWLPFEQVGHNDEAQKELARLIGPKQFSTPKPVRLLRHLLAVFVDEDSLVCDFFAGSGTLGDAVMRNNLEKGTRIRHLSVQLPEAVDSPLQTIAGIARKRLTATGTLLSADDSRATDHLDLGFRAYRLSRSVLAPAPEGLGDALFTDPAKSDVDDEALLTELLLARGFDLTIEVAWHEVAGTSVANVADGALLVCFTRDMTSELFEALVDLEPAQLILLEAGFGGNDEVKVNALQHLKTANAHRQTPIELLVV